ncbi:redox-sensitive transcriptional activator SoxR [Kibdelosporangium aridum]|uniref:MerR family transcriptional regulator, redox-sensitive transcriptional activator SoxR n=1 Tax=Kibdelosporangium aridum TaxID=2030 RepID=A0A1Y5Y2A0_KIBAR|nr:redox-sensitive transcriptional activator SoxR [Kibdelosporangium aridum]SMD24364.1 MerR family transcriptional regulator, redox-sensitive transcriptional activator SoxR [Kibdelosporangium aridum]
MSPSTELTVGELARRAGVPVSTLHFYEAKGLISSRRTAGNQRRFRRDTLRRIAFIRIGQRVGVPLNTIAEVLGRLPEGRVPNRTDWAEVSESWRAELDARIEQLLQLRDDFTDCVGCGCLSLDRCALANKDDQLASHGAGPRRLIEARTRQSADSLPSGESADCDPCGVIPTGTGDC